MAKRFKLKFTVPSFQMCRSKDLSSFPGNPVPAIYRLSPVNPKARDIGYPTLPGPPPSSPEGKVSSKTMSIAQGCQMCRDKENKLVKAKSRKSTSSVPSRRSNFLIDSINEEESETLISCLISFSDEFCHDEMVLSPGTESHYKTEKDLISRHRRKVSSLKKVQKVRFNSVENIGGTETKEVKKKTSTVMSRSSSMSMEGKVKESFAVVKKSKDPYEDFKKSMLEMIAEMEMSEAEDLEQLLQCFLALNSRNYHAVIVRAFMEIWQQMFTWNPTSIKNLQTDVEK